MKSILPFKRQLALLGTILLGYSAQAQVATTYNFSQSVGTYTAITGGTVLANAAMGNMDDEVFPITIPAFSFDGVSYTTAQVHTNGYLTFGSVSDLDYFGVSSTYNYDGVIAAFATDLDDAGSGAGARNIRVQQVGTEYIVQWQNVARYDVAGTGERISFQIRLNTANNEIKIVYGGTIVLGNDTYYPEVGLRGSDTNFATNVNNREVISTTGAWVNSLPGTDEFSTCHFDSNDPATLPAVGTTFTWTGAPDISASLLSFTSSNGCYGATEEVSLTLTNTGGTAIDFSVTPVTINSDVSGTNPMTFTPITINTGTLAANATQTVQLSPSYDMSAGGSSYIFNATLSMTGDIRPANNTLDQTILNQRPAPDYADITACSGEVVTLGGTSSVSPYNTSISNNTALPIPDEDPVGATSTIIVSGAGAALASDVTITLSSLTHTYTSDLTINLIAPDGSSIVLALEAGFDANFINTTFSDAAIDPISFGDNPFTGEYQPENPFSDLTGSANGTWQLQIVDNYGFDEGTLNEWSISFTSANSVVSYSWTPAANLSDATVSNPDATLTSTETYTVTVTDERGCTASDDVEVIISTPTVTASSDATGNMICEGESVVLTGGGNATDYDWDNSVSDGIAFEPASTGTYTVTGTDADGCTNTATITITVNPNPTAALTLPVSELCVYNNPLTLSGGSPASGSYSGTGVSGGSFNPAAAGTGTFTVTYLYTDGNGCSASATDNILVDACLGLEENTQTALQVYPNPGNGVFTISTGGSDLLTGINMVDAQGKTVPFELVGQTELTIDLSTAENGVYFLTGIVNGTTVISRLVKQ